MSGLPRRQEGTSLRVGRSGGEEVPNEAKSMCPDTGNRSWVREGTGVGD